MQVFRKKMSKSAKRRNHTNRLRNKWLKLLKGIDHDRNLQCITFGRIYNSDPLDCGVPRCTLCSYQKVHKRKYRRSRQKIELLEEWNSL